MRLPKTVTSGGSLHSLVDHLPAPTVDVQGRALVGSPNLLVPVCAGPLLKVAGSGRTNPLLRLSGRTIMPSSQGERSWRSSMSSFPSPTAATAQPVLLPASEPPG